MSTSSTQAGQISPDGQFRWDGQQWVPVAAGYREQTSWTRPLRLAVAAYLVVSVIYSIAGAALYLNAAGIERAIRASGSSVPADQLEQAVQISVVVGWVFVLVLTGVSIVLAIGSFLGWRWAFWVTLVWLGLNSIGVISNVGSLANASSQPQPPAVIAGSLLLSLVALALFIWMLVSAIRYGPWAMRKPGSQ
jgi:lysylphosphatidylglycerol synthetase-like protein (DUF2156 family)